MTENRLKTDTDRESEQARERDRVKFAKHVVVSAGVCYAVRENGTSSQAKVSAKFRIETLLSRLIEDCSTNH